MHYIIKDGIETINPSKITVGLDPKMEHHVVLERTIFVLTSLCYTSLKCEWYSSLRRDDRISVSWNFWSPVGMILVFGFESNMEIWRKVAWITVEPYSGAKAIW